MWWQVPHLDVQCTKRSHVGPYQHLQDRTRLQNEVIINISTLFPCTTAFRALDVACLAQLKLAESMANSMVSVGSNAPRLVA